MQITGVDNEVSICEPVVPHVPEQAPDKLL